MSYFSEFIIISFFCISDENISQQNTIACVYLYALTLGLVPYTVPLYCRPTIEVGRFNFLFSKTIEEKAQFQRTHLRT